jgi:hypothetical protein
MTRTSLLNGHLNLSLNMPREKRARGCLRGLDGWCVAKSNRDRVRPMHRGAAGRKEAHARGAIISRTVVWT